MLSETVAAMSDVPPTAVVVCTDCLGTGERDGKRCPSCEGFGQRIGPRIAQSLTPEQLAYYAEMQRLRGERFTPDK